MNLQNLKLKASTLCAGGTLLVFGGFLTVNLAGCGGGGNGGLTTVPTPRPVGATFSIVQQDGTPSKGGTVTLTGNGQTYTGTAAGNGVATLNNVPPGTYTVTFTAFASNGAALPTTSRMLSITRSGAQNYILVQGDTGNGAFSISGTIFSNPGNAANRACTASSTPITGAVLISVRDLNDTTGSPIVAQITRPAQDSGVATNLRGRYSISVPALSGQRTFRVEASPAGNSGFQVAGVSGTTTFVQGSTTLTGVDICANTNGVIPAPVVTPTPVPTDANGTPFPIATVTPTPAPTLAPGVTPTATTRPTATPTVRPTVPGTVTGGTTGVIIGGVNGTATGTATGTTTGTVNGTTTGTFTGTTTGTTTGFTTGTSTGSTTGVIVGSTTSGSTNGVVVVRRKR